MNNAMNSIVNEQLKNAMAGLHHLDDLGATVLHVVLGERKPVISIDGAHEPFLHGALKSRMTFNGITRCVMVASVHGCQVEWNESYATPAKAVQS